MKVEFSVISGSAAILGLVCYLTACCYYRVRPPIEKVLEALGFGGLIPIGLRMVYAAFYPEELCSVLDEHEKIFTSNNVHVSFGEHVWEIIAGGVCITLASIYSLMWLCRNSSHPHP